MKSFMEHYESENNETKLDESFDPLVKDITVTIDKFIDVLVKNNQHGLISSGIKKALRSSKLEDKILKLIKF